MIINTAFLLLVLLLRSYRIAYILITCAFVGAHLIPREKSDWFHIEYDMHYASHLINLQRIAFYGVIRF